MPLASCRRLALAAAAGVVIAGGPGAALAQTAGAPLPAVVQQLLDCRAKGEAAARPACYDQAVDDLQRQIASGEIVMVDKDRVAKVKRQAFGFSLPSLSALDHGEKGGEVEEVAARATGVRKQPNGFYEFELEDGQVWVQTEAETMSRFPRAGDKVAIRKGAFGSFFMSIESQVGIRVRRIR